MSEKNDTTFFQKTAQFLREVRVETKKVTWPTRKETLASTAIVLITTFIIAFFLGGVDLLLQRIVEMLLS
ncbi:MAG: preprotein translocase subunit SecE [Deltaproteobacteria bacterium]|nr:preprotein translocase subunit SecE [Candidatus Zymogenaceae bacterium]